MRLRKAELDLLLRRVARRSVSLSSVRGLPEHTMETAVKFLWRPGLLGGFDKADNAESFRRMLSARTIQLRKILPTEKRAGKTRGAHWGNARKFLNIFLFECALNRYLCEHFKNLKKIEPWLEVPLDSFVGKKLSREPKNVESPHPLSWKTTIGLQRDVSDRYQELAQAVADEKGIYRVHLDLYYFIYE